MMKVLSSHNFVDDEFGIDDIEFENDYHNFELNRMYPPTNTDRMSRAEFIRYKRKQIFRRRARKES